MSAAHEVREQIFLWVEALDDEDLKEVGSSRKRQAYPPVL
jgi:hypothetical protein